MESGNVLSPVQKEIICGLTSGTATVLVTHPLDLIKVRLQLSRSQKTSSYTNIIKNTILINKDNASANRNWKEAYRGLNINLIGNAVSWGLYFGLYRFFKDRIHDFFIEKNNGNEGVDINASKSSFQNDQKLNSMMYLTAAWSAGITTSVLTNPIWVIKTRMMGSTTYELENYRKYHKISSTIREMVRKEGWKSFTKGLVPSIFGVSQGAIYFSCYDTLKMRWFHNTTDQVEKRLSALDYILITSLSKMISVTTVYPLQLLKSNLQYSNKEQFLGFAELMSKIYNQPSGKTWKNFYKGLNANLIRAIPSTCITFYLYESMKHLL